MGFTVAHDFASIVEHSSDSRYRPLPFFAAEEWEASGTGS